MIAPHAFADQVIATTPVGKFPVNSAVNPDTNQIYVSTTCCGLGFTNGTNSVFVLDGATNSIENTILFGAFPSDDVGSIAVNPSTNRIYVEHNLSANPPNPEIAVIDGNTNAVIDEIQHANGFIFINPNTDKIYLAHVRGIVVIDGSTDQVVNQITTCGIMGEPSINTVTDKIYVPCSKNPQGSIGKSEVQVIDASTDTVTDTIPFTNESMPRVTAVNPITNTVYVESTNSTMYVMDGNTDSVIGKINGISIGSIVVNPSANMIYVSNQPPTWNTVSVINGSSNQLVDQLTVGNSPDGISVNPTTNRIYVANVADGTVSIIQGSTPPPATTSQLQVNSRDSFGNAITGFFTKLYAQNGTQIDSGITPASFTLGNGQTYTVHVGNSAKFKFNHWLDTGSTDANRTISITSDKSITAVYATIPTHPSNLTATAVSPSEIDLSWSASSSDGGSPVTGYRIQSSTDGTTWTTIVKNTGNTSTTYSDTGLSPNTIYYYRVFALNAVGSSYRSNIASATTPVLTVAGSGITLGNVQSTSGTTSPSNQMTLSGYSAGTGSNQLLLVGVSANNNNVTSVTFGGVPLTRAANSYTNNDAEFWYLPSPAGSGDIVVTFLGPTQAVVGAYLFSGVDQTAPIATVAKVHNLSASSPAISITTKYPNDLVLDLPSIYGGSTLGSPTCTQQWDANVPNAITGASSSAAVPLPSTVSCGWTASSADFWDDVAVELKAAG